MITGSTSSVLCRLLLAAILLGASRPSEAQTIATFELGTGSATFGLALPQGVARDGVRVGSLATQNDVKTRWPDGSVRFVIVSARVASGAAFPIIVGGSDGGSFTPRWPDASVRFTIAGATYIASLPQFDGTDSWLSGPQVRESRVTVAPTAGGVPHPLLQVIFDVRSYADGGHRVDITVQNVKDVPGGDTVLYDVTVSLGNATVYQKREVSHSYLTRWRKTFSTPELAEASVTPDFAPFIAAGAVPKFAETVISPDYEGVAGERYDILTWGDMTSYMPTPGGRPDIGFYPYWVAQYLVHRTAAQRGYMLKHADLSGSWSGHITEPDGVTRISLDTYPNYWIDARSLGRPNGPHTLAGIAEMIEDAHMPDLTYVPYLVTGDRYYLDQTKFWANYALISTWPLDPNVPRTARGLLFQNQVRGIAWGLRAVGEAASITPDADPEKGYFTDRVQANLDFFAQWSRDGDFGPLEVVFSGKWGTSTGGFEPGALLAIAPWMNQYVAWTLDYLGGMGFGPVAPIRDRIARFWVRLFTSEPDYPRKFAAPYVLYGGRIVATPGGGIAVDSTRTMRTLFCDSFTCPPPDPHPGLTPFVGYYGPEARAGLILAERLHVVGAAAARAWLEAQPGVMEDVNARSGFAIASDDPRPLPASLAEPPRPPTNVRIVR